MAVQAWGEVWLVISFNSPDSFIEYTLQVALGQGGTLEVLASLDVLGTGQCLLVRDGLHSLRTERVEGGSVLAQIELGSDEDNGNVGSVVVDLGVPLQHQCCQYSQTTLVVSFCMTQTAA